MVFKMINIFLSAARQNYKPSLREGQILLQYSRTHQYQASFKESRWAKTEFTSQTPYVQEPF